MLKKRCSFIKIRLPVNLKLLSIFRNHILLRSSAGNCNDLLPWQAAGEPLSVRTTVPEDIGAPRPLLLSEGHREELLGVALHLGQQLLVDPVVPHLKEPVLLACLVDLAGDLHGKLRATPQKATEVDDGEVELLEAIFWGRVNRVSKCVNIVLIAIITLILFEIYH